MEAHDIRVYKYQLIKTLLLIFKYVLAQCLFPVRAVALNLNQFILKSAVFRSLMYRLLCRLRKLRINLAYL